MLRQFKIEAQLTDRSWLEPRSVVKNRLSRKSKLFENSGRKCNVYEKACFTSKHDYK